MSERVSPDRVIGNFFEYDQYTRQIIATNILEDGYGAARIVATDIGFTDGPWLVKLLNDGETQRIGRTEVL